MCDYSLEKNPFYATVAPLRLLFLKRDNPEVWARVTSLMSNNKVGEFIDSIKVGVLIVKFMINYKQ